MPADRVRVVFVTTVFEGIETGPGTFVRYLCEAFLDSDEIEFHVVAPRLSMRHPRLHAAGAGSGSLDLYRRVQRLARSVVAERRIPTVLHGNSTHSMGMLTGHPGPLVVQVNDYETARTLQRLPRIAAEQGARGALAALWRFRQERKVLAATSLALCNSEFTAAEIRRIYGLDGLRCRTLYKAVDVDAFKRPAQLPPDPLAGRPRDARLLFVGTDWRRKGLETLLDAFAGVARTHPSALLAVIGPPKDDPAVLRRLEQAGLIGRVLMIGRAERAELAAHLWHADVFVLPSLREAFGVAVLEAMAAGVPVVAARSGGIPEIIRTDAQGELVAPGDSRRLEATLRALIDDAPRRRALAIAGPARAAEFGVARMIGQLRDTYRELAAAAAVGRSQEVRRA